MISLKITETPDIDWNNRILGTGLATMFQTLERAEYFKETNHPHYFLQFVDSNEKIVGQLLVNIVERFRDTSLKTKIFGKTPGIKKKICTWLYGPIIFNTKLNHEIYKTLKKFLQTNGYLANGWTHPLLPIEQSFLQNNFNTKKWGTFMIDLSNSKEQLYQNIQKHSGRKNIERSRKRGVKIEEITETNLEDYFILRSDFREELGIGKANFEGFFKKWKKYRSLGYSGFLAKKDEIPIGGLIFSFVDGHIIESGVARSKLDTKENLYSQDLIKWSIIEWGVENNMKWYNLTGFNPNPDSKKEEGILRYKKKWGGNLYEYHRILG